MSGRRSVFAYVLLLAPVAVLLWLGSTELRRLGERADLALRSQAVGFLRLARQALDDELSPWLDRVIAPDAVALDRHPPETAAWELHRRFPEARNLLVLDGEGNLAFPRPNPTRLGFALAQLPDDAHPALVRAEGLLAEAQRTGEGTGPALEAFDAYLALDDQRGDRAGQARASFRRATILSLDHKLEALAAFRDFDALFDTDVAPLPESVTELPLLARVARVQLMADGAEALLVMEDIARGSYDGLHDELLSAVMRRVEPWVAGDTDRAAAAQAALARDQFRRAGRAFAREFGLVARETVRRRIRANPTTGRFQQVLVNQRGSSSLLVFRPTTAREREHVSGAWVGIHVDPTLLLYDAMSPFLQAGEHGFHLIVADAEGIPVLSSEAAAATEDAIAQDAVAGLVLRAVPIDPEQLARVRAADARNRLWLLITLGVLTVTGALWLWFTMRREAEVAQLKVSFVSRVSHELKTPLALVRMYGETLSRGRAKTEDQQRQFAGIITRESERLTVLIDRILDFSRQESGSLVYEPTDVDLAEVTEAVAEAYRPHLESRGLPLVVDVAGPLPACADRNALEGALVNLMENAAKYTENASAETPLEVSARRHGERAVLRVADRGIGIPPGDRRRVFDSFYRASNSGEVRGAGLGLSLVQHFVRAHGGTIEALDHEGGGTIMEIGLPLQTGG